MQLLQELMQVSRNNNSIDQFGNKIRLLMYALISKNPEKYDYYEKMALEIFLDKLNPIVAIIIKLKNVENLEQAITVAKHEESKLRARREQQN